MEYFNKIACVTIDDLTGGDDPVMTRANYDKMVSRGKFTVLRPGKGLGTYALIEYSSMPERIKERFKEVHGNIYELLKDSINAELIIDSEARKFYNDHTLPDGSHLPVETQLAYTINASVLNALNSMLNDRIALRKALGGSTRNLWETVIGVCEKFRQNPGHTLPNNSAVIRKKLNEYKKFGYEALISGKFCNENTVKITEEAGNVIIGLKRSKVPVYTNQQIFNEFNRRAPELGFKPLKSIQALILFLKRPDVEPLWYDAQYGELAARQRYSRKNKTKLPQLRDALWYSDGTKLNLYYKAYDKNGKLVIRTTSVYEVIDAYSEMLLGYYISDSENYEAQYNAFRMAIQISGCKPYEVVNDNQGGHKKLESSDFFKRIARVSRRTAPYSGQSKTIESIFGRFQSQVLHKYWFFTGQNITAVKKDSHVNLEFIEANKNNLPTLEELKKIYAECRREWNNMPHPATGVARREMYVSSVNPQTEKVTFLDMVDMFWMTTAKSSTYTSSGIQIVVNNRKYVYEVLDAHGMPDLRFVKEKNMLYQKYRVMYDPSDMTIVRLYEETASGLKYVADAQPYADVHRAIQDQKPGDMKLIRQMDALNKQLHVERLNEAYAIEDKQGVNPEFHGLNRQGLKGITIKKASKVESETVDIGLYNKKTSNMVADPLDFLNRL